MKIESPVKKFPGYVVLPEYLTVPQVKAITNALDDPNEPPKVGKVWAVVNQEKRLPAILACVSEWHLAGVPEKPELETFPASPAKSAGNLIAWLFEEVNKLWLAEEEVPNE